jgi:hypothetical protein
MPSVAARPKAEAGGFSRLPSVKRQPGAAQQLLDLGKSDIFVFLFVIVCDTLVFC